MAKVVNVSRSKSDYIYIGRGSKWGNVFTHLPRKELSQSFQDAVITVPTRAKAIYYYEKYLFNNINLLNSLHELIGFDLGCYCKPAQCHGDIILDAINKLNLEKKHGRRSTEQQWKERQLFADVRANMPRYIIT